jgi:hypothetical protein
MANLRISVGDAIRRKTLMQIDFTVVFASGAEGCGFNPRRAYHSTN